MESIIYTSFLLGISSSLHCITMCGPLSIIFMSGKDKNILNNFLYQIGRIITYVCLGIIFSIIGYYLNINYISNYLSIFLGFIIIINTFLSLKLNIINNSIINFFIKIKTYIINKFKHTSSKYFILLGILNGFLPCSALYTSLILALTFDHIHESIIFMFLFGISTIPSMFFSFILGTYIHNIKYKKYFKSLSILINIFLGFLLLFRGSGVNIKYIFPHLNFKIYNSLDCILNLLVI